jgi:hypothetical protein
MNFDFRGNLSQNFSSQKAPFLHLIRRVEGIIKYFEDITQFIIKNESINYKTFKKKSFQE